MKEGFFKKLAIGVAVSLVSTAIIAGVSGLFSSGGSGGNNDVCTHETRTTDGEIAPTCLLGGVSGMVRCLDCGEIVVEGEELPPVGHTGELGETCTVCNEVIYGQYQNANIYTLQDIESGEKVAGNWYRFELSVWIESSNMFVVESKDWTMGDTSGDAFVIWSQGNVLFSGMDKYGFVAVDSLLPIVRVVRPDGSEYADVYFQEGITFETTEVLESGQVEISHTITADTYISTVSDVQKLVFGE